MQFEKIPADIMVNHIFPALTNGAAYNLAFTLDGHKEFKVLVSCFFAITTQGCSLKDMADFAAVFFDGFMHDKRCMTLMKPMLEYEWGSGKNLDAMFSWVERHPNHLKEANELFAMVKDDLLAPGFRASDKAISAVEREIAPPEPIYTPGDRADFAIMGSWW